MQFTTLYNIDKNFLIFFNGSNYPFVDKLATTLTQGYWWIPFYISLLIIVIKNGYSLKDTVITLGSVILCISLSDGMADWVIKPLVGRLRPIYNPELADYVKKVNGFYIGGYSFFSAHASNTTSISTFFTLLVKNKWLAVSMFAWVMVNSWTRLYLGVHYPSDILAGIIWGIICGIISYIFYRKLNIMLKTRNTNNCTIHLINQYNLYYINAAIFILILSFIIALFYNLL